MRVAPPFRALPAQEPENQLVDEARLSKSVRMTRSQTKATPERVQDVPPLERVLGRQCLPKRMTKKNKLDKKITCLILLGTVRLAAKQERRCMTKLRPSSLRQSNYRHRLDLETVIGHYWKEVKRNPPDHPMLWHNLKELEKCTKEYIKLNKNKKKPIY